METETYQMHLVAGRTYGPDSSCTGKIDYGTERTAEAVAERMSIRNCRHLEAYPCTWCGGWHIGRALTDDEVARFLKIVRGVSDVRTR